MRNVTQFFRDSDETRVGIFGPDSTHLAFFVMWRPFLWLFGHVENFSTRPIALASFVARRKKRGLSGHIEKFSTCRIHLALFVAWQKVRGVSVAVRPVNHCTLARRHRYQPSAKTPVPKTRETLDARHKRSHPISALLLCNTDIRARPIAEAAEPKCSGTSTHTRRWRMNKMLSSACLVGKNQP